jgi:ABC-type transport system involved in multi-copper enzyme maturation permease subunit
VRLLSSELLKLRTTRVSWVLLVLTAAFSGLVAAALVGSGSLEDDRALALAQGANFWTMLAVVLGVLIVTNEYRHGTVMTTFLAEPQRPRVLGAKLAVAVAAGTVLALGAALATAAVALPWLAVRDEALAFDGQALEAVGRLVLAFALSAALGTAVGAIVQNQVGTIVSVFVWFLIVESIVGLVAALLFGDLGEPDPVSPYLPGSALGGVVGGQGSEFMLRGGPATALAFGYVAVLSAVGALAMTRRDP